MNINEYFKDLMKFMDDFRKFRVIYVFRIVDGPKEDDKDFIIKNEKGEHVRIT